ncbi:hypothetical protein QTI66_31190 [Variovorax sp. J22R133]|uniref:hypothetical protein n=1 Tax=Variovorax brevis TaxID=3053503 RepID=UPI0025766198|nr:hypothetical protein [Variovorax sp. J22R133]MDM0116610.1 hypothetical protein [Variovorax sp. J22R133]
MQLLHGHTTIALMAIAIVSFFTHAHSRIRLFPLSGARESWLEMRFYVSDPLVQS